MAKDTVSNSIQLLCKREGIWRRYRWSDMPEEMFGVGESREEALEDLDRVRREAFLVRRDPTMGWIIREEPDKRFRFPV